MNRTDRSCVYRDVGARTIDGERLGDMAAMGASASEPDATEVELFEEFYVRLHPGMVRLARGILLDRELAQDVVQECFARLMPRWEGVREPERYLSRSVVNACRNSFRRRLRSSDVADDVFVEDDSRDLDLLQALAHLSPRRRAVVALRYLEDWPEATIAEVLGMRPGTVKSTLHAALGALRKELDDRA